MDPCELGSYADRPAAVVHTGVLVNQHREATFKSALVEIEHANGKVALTPDHVHA